MMHKTNRNLGWYCTAVVVGLPMMLWLSAHGFGSLLRTPTLTLTNLSKLLGITGLALLSWNIILSARLKPLERLFFGLDRLYKAHHIIGGLAFIFLLIHPMLLTITYVQRSIISAFEFLNPLTNLLVTTGELALGLMIIIMVITLYLKVKHEHFIKWHRLLGVVLLLGAVHGIFNSSSDIRNYVLLELYIISLVAVALGVYIYRSIFHGSFTKRYDYVVELVKQLGLVNEVTLSPSTERLQFIPGQFAFIKFLSNHVAQQTHPFTISSGNNEPVLRFSIKQLGDFTSTLRRLKKGDQISVEGPYGTFSYRKMTFKHQIWIAGGIGITPFLSMARSLNEPDYQIDLFYSVASQNEAVFSDELQDIASDHINFKFHLIDTSNNGFLTAEKIKQQSGSLTNADILLCGPPPMMKSLRLQFRRIGVKREHIRYEEFSLA